MQLSVKELKWWLSCVPYVGLYYIKRLFKRFTFGNSETMQIVKDFEEGSTLVVSCGQSTVPTTVEVQ